jgi:hypothetical protein
MKDLIGFAYLVATLLWLPLLGILFVVKPTSSRGNLIFASIVSGITFIYEAYMRAAFSTSIRVDVIFILAILCVMDGISGFVFLGAATDRADGPRWKAGLRLAGALCLSVPLLAVLGAVGFMDHLTSSDKSSNDGRRFRFETAFRNADNERNRFGVLASKSNQWAGYYIGGNQDDRYQHIVINEEGKIWVFNRALTAQIWKGHQNPKNEAEFNGEISEASEYEYFFSLQHVDAERDQFSLRIKNAYDAVPVKLTFKKQSPPRFPVEVLPSDKVKFIGVFSAKYDVSDKFFRVVQLWLWEENGKMWGRHHQWGYTPGLRQGYISSSAVSIKCSANCTVMTISVEGERSDSMRVTRGNELTIRLPGISDEIALQRGAIVPGFIFDQAPLSSGETNREWLNAVTNAELFMNWDVPLN